MKLQISREELSYWHLWLTARVESKLLIIILTDVASFYILLTETTVSCTTLPVKHYATVNHLTIDEIVQHSICKMHNSWLPWNISYTPKKLETFFFVETACEWFIHLWPCIFRGSESEIYDYLNCWINLRKTKTKGKLTWAVISTIALRHRQPIYTQTWHFFFFCFANRNYDFEPWSIQRAR